MGQLLIMVSLHASDSERRPEIAHAIHSLYPRALIDVLFNRPLTERPLADIESHVWVRIHSGAYRSDEDLRTYAMNVIAAVGRALAPVLSR